MFRHAHPLMQDTCDADAVGVDPIDNNVGTDQIASVCRRQIGPAVAKLRVATDGLQCVVDLVTVGQQLVLSPSLAGVAQDVDEVQTRFRGKFD